VDRSDLFLERELEKMLAANGNLIEAVDAFNANSDPDKQNGIIAVILGSLHKPSEANFWLEGVETNKALLEILRNMKFAGYEEVRKPLENYCGGIHKLEGIRDQQGNLLEIVKQHLMFDVGRTLEACKLRSYPPRPVPQPTHWRSK
jgi:hypothetical protein